MPNFINKLFSQFLAVLAFGLTTLLLAVPKQATTQSGKSLDQGAEGVINFIYTDVRPVVFIFVVIATVVGVIGSRDKGKVALGGGLIAAVVAILPWLLVKAYAWFF